MMETIKRDLQQRYDTATAKASALKWRLTVTENEPTCQEQAEKARLLASERRAWESRIRQTLALLSRLTRREPDARADTVLFLIETAGNSPPIMPDPLWPTWFKPRERTTPIAQNGTESTHSDVLTREPINGTANRPKERRRAWHRGRTASKRREASTK